MKQIKGEEKLNVICPLCLEEKHEKVCHYIGGYLGYAHPSCMENASRAIKYYGDWLWLQKLINEKREAP